MEIYKKRKKKKTQQTDTAKEVEERRHSVTRILNARRTRKEIKRKDGHRNSIPSKRGRGTRRPKETGTVKDPEGKLNMMEKWHDQRQQ